MPRFKIEATATVVRFEQYTVEADTPEEALEIVQDGYGPAPDFTDEEYVSDSFRYAGEADD